MLTALVTGYDVMGKLGRSSWAWAHSAMGLAEGDLVTHFYGLVGRNGLLSALLAREGEVAAMTSLEGRFGFYRTFFGEVPPDLPDVLDTLGQTFEILDATVKTYPGTGMNIVPIQLALDLVAKHQISADDVAKVRLCLPAERENFAEGHHRGPFRMRTAAQSSAPFQVAIVLMDGKIDYNRGPPVADTGRLTRHLTVPTRWSHTPATRGVGVRVNVHSRVRVNVQSVGGVGPVRWSELTFRSGKSILAFPTGK